MLRVNVETETGGGEASASFGARCSYKLRAATVYSCRKHNRNFGGCFLRRSVQPCCSTGREQERDAWRNWTRGETQTSGVKNVDDKIQTRASDSRARVLCLIKRLARLFEFNEKKKIIQERASKSWRTFFRYFACI